MSFRRILLTFNPQCLIRGYSKTSQVYSKVNIENKLRTTLHEAEKTVGYPTSFLSLRWILNDEISNIATHIKKLLGTNHPILETARNVLLRNELATWGLIVLLFSKVAGLNSKFPELECDQITGILHSQRSLAEITEMINTSYMIHRSLINIHPEDNNYAELHFGNNLALLCGDYLLSKSFHELSQLRNSQVQEIMATTLRDQSDAEFLGIRDSQNQPLPSKQHAVQSEIPIPFNYDTSPYDVKKYLGCMKSEWILRNILSSGSLLGKACQATLVLSHHDTKHQKLGYEFGRNFALAWQARLDQNCLKNDKFSLISSPVMLHLEDDPSLYTEIEKGQRDVNDVNYNLIRNIVISGLALDKSKQLQDEFTKSTLDNLSAFHDSDAKTALVKILKSL